MQGNDSASMMKNLTARLRLNKYHKHFPHPPQALFMAVDQQEVLYGGAAGGGKTDALLMAALQYVHVPGYNAVIFRRTFPQLSLAGGLISRALEWLAPWIGTGEVGWNDQKKTLYFLSGATLRFAHLQHEKNKYDHQGAEYQFIGWDELTHFSESVYRYLLSRLRRAVGVNAPLRVRATSNPGGEGHTWVKHRFVTGDDPRRLFIPARLEDNPSLDAEEYEEALACLDEVDYERLRKGNWDIDRGAIFDRSWFKSIERDKVPAGLTWKRFWDLAASEKTTADCTASVLGAMDDLGNLYLADGIHGRWLWPKARALIQRTCHAEGTEVEVGVEAVASWRVAVDDLHSVKDLARHRLVAITVSGDKVSRALPWSARAQRGQVHLVAGPWVMGFLDHLVAFPAGQRDWVDAVSGLVQMLTGEVARPASQKVAAALARLRFR